VFGQARLLTGLMIALCFSACSNDTEIKKAIQINLKDPNSAKFELILISEDQSIACAIWNAKNGFGGYGELEISELRKRDGTWRISQKKIDRDLCNSEIYKIRDEIKRREGELLKSDKTPSELKELIRNSQDVEYESPMLMRAELEALRKF